MAQSQCLIADHFAVDMALVLQAVPMGTVKRSTDANQPEFKPECHIFYGTRINDMQDDLPKWCAECLLVGSQTRATVMLEC